MTDNIPIEIEKSRRSGRDAKFYFDVFHYGVNGQNIAGKKILDIGSGDSNFADVVNKQGLGSVIRVDADYAKRPPSGTHQAVGAMAQKVPFRENAFDEVVALYTPYWMSNALSDTLSVALSEMIRVTKPGGKIKVYPVETISPYTSFQEFPQVKLLIAQGYGHSTLEITKDSNMNPDQWERLIKAFSYKLKITKGDFDMD